MSIDSWLERATIGISQVQHEINTFSASGGCRSFSYGAPAFGKVGVCHANDVDSISNHWCASGSGQMPGAEANPTQSLDSGDSLFESWQPACQRLGGSPSAAAASGA